MRFSRPPLFLERRAYRRRRAMDAARMLPLLGAVLLLIPLLWAPQKTEASDTASGWLFIFAVWLGLIVASFLLSRKLCGGIDPPPAEDADGPA